MKNIQLRIETKQEIAARFPERRSDFIKKRKNKSNILIDDHFVILLLSADLGRLAYFMGDFT